MRFLRHVLGSDDGLPKEELDDLFDQLEQLEPPPSLIAHMLALVSRLPLPRPLEDIPWHELDTLMVRREQDPPC